MNKDVVDGLRIVIVASGVKIHELYPIYLEAMKKASKQYAMLYCAMSDGRDRYLASQPIYSPNNDYRSIQGLVFKEYPKLVFSLQGEKPTTYNLGYKEIWELPSAEDAQIWNDNLELAQNTLVEIQKQDEHFKWKGETLYVCKKKY